MVKRIKRINTKTNKYFAFRQFLFDSIEDACSVYIVDLNIKDGVMFTVYSRNSLTPTLVTIKYDLYKEHKGDWSKDLVVSEYSLPFGGNNLYYHEVVLKPVGELLLENI